MTRQSKANSSRPLTWGVVRAARDSNPNRQIRSLVLCVDLVGSSRIWPAHVGCLVGPDGSRRILSDRLDDQTDDQAPWSLPRHSRRHVGPGHKILNLVVDPHEVMRVTRALTPFPWTHTDGCADSARRGVRKRSSSRRHRPPRVRWAAVWPPRTAATPRGRPVGRFRAAQ
jgi:hypothetical protein